MLQFGRQNERFPLRNHSAGGGLAVGVAVACTVFTTTPAAGYCRTRTCEFERLDSRATSAPCVRDPDTQCALSSQDTYWDAVCLALSVHTGGSAAQGISADQLREQLDAALEQWLQIDCGAGPHLGAFVRGFTQCDQLEYACSQDSEGTPPGYGANENLVVFRDGPSQLAFNQVALTTVTANLKTGQVVDADIELNSRNHDFVLQPEQAQGEAYLLRTVLSHEFGHFLGLSHSLEPGAVMGMYGSQSAQPGDDDRAGFCEIWGSEEPVNCSLPDASAMACVGSDTDCPPQTVASVQNGGGGCSLPGASSPPAPPALLSSLGGLLLVGLRRKLRRLSRVRNGAGTAILVGFLSSCSGTVLSPSATAAPGAVASENVQEPSGVDSEDSTAGPSAARKGRNPNTKRCVFRRGRQARDTLAPGGGLGLTPFRPHHGLLGPMRCE